MLINPQSDVLEKEQDSPEKLDGLLLEKMSSCISGSSTSIFKNCPQKWIQEGSCELLNPDQVHIQQTNQDISLKFDMSRLLTSWRFVRSDQ